jgi:hypothetical protein
VAGQLCLAVGAGTSLGQGTAPSTCALLRRNRISRIAFGPASSKALIASSSLRRARAQVYSGNLNGFERAGTPSLTTVTTTAQPCTTDCCPGGTQCRCCGLGYSRVLGGEITLFWTAQSNLDRLQYRVAVRVFGAQAPYDLVGIISGSEATVTGLSFAVAGYQFHLRGGQKAANTLDPETVAVQMVVPVSEPERRNVNLRVDNVSDTSISVSWRRPYSVTDLMQISYIVQVCVCVFELLNFSRASRIDLLKNVFLC